MRNRTVLILITIVTFNYLSALELNGPILVIGPDEEKAEKSYYKVHDIFKVKDVLVWKDEIYILDRGTSYVHRFDMKGNSKGKIGGLGAGPSELYEPNSMSIVGNNLWVADFNNSRIQEFCDFKYKRTLKLKNPAMPYNIAVSGENVLITSRSIYPWQKSLPVFDYSGILKKKVDLNFRLLKSKKIPLWYGAKIISLPDDRILIGYIYIPIIILISNDLRSVKEVDLSDYYITHVSKSSSGVRFPGGYAATAFSSGPGNSILIAACQNKEKMCNRVLQFSNDLSRKIAEINTDFHIRGMFYFPEKQLIAFINGAYEVMFYEIQ